MNETTNKFKVSPLLIFSVTLALYWVVFLWGFWTKDVNALGINLTVFWLLAFAFFATSIKKNLSIKLLTKKNLFWTVPFIAMSLSFGLYENPWLKFITAAILPIIFGFFINYSLLEHRSAHTWNAHFLSIITQRIFEVLNKFGEATKRFGAIFFLYNTKRLTILKKVLLGLVIFFVVAMIFFVPLLMSADPAFATTIREINKWFILNIQIELVWKVLFWVVASVTFIASFLGWANRFKAEPKDQNFSMDAVISGVVLGGILVLYLLFIWTQLQHLWVDTLPSDFKATESLVKNGFWQLFILSIANVFLFFLYYRNTHRHVQKVLAAFTFASFLLLISAAQRMFLYVTLYGFSYEKFFATYTVIYAIILFIALISFLFHKKKADILKFLAITFLWMFSIATILPIEQIIFRANIALSQRAESRIDLFELRILSYDVIDLVQNYRTDSEWNSTWQPWIQRKEKLQKQKAWYEKNLSSIKNTE